MKNNKVLVGNKYGITMIALIITIMVALILISAGIVTVSNSISDATLTAFAEDLNTVQDQINLYYLQNNSFPTNSVDEEALSQGQVKNLVTDQETFVNELELNGELNEDDNLGAFYKIDLSKINIENTVRGTQKEGDESDIYVVSAITMKVYYIKGLVMGKEIYYSLTPKIIKYVKTVENVNQENVYADYQTSGSLSVKKIKKTWSNKMGITLNAYLDPGENLYINVGDTDYKFSTNTGTNIFVFNDSNELLKSVDANDKESLVETLNTQIDTNHYIEFIKKNGNNVIDTLKVDLSNYDLKAPSSLNNYTFTEGEQENIVKFSVNDDRSGIKEIRYDYIKRYNEDGIVENYYKGVDELEGAFLKARGKKVSAVDNSEIEIKIPKDIEGIQILILDKADNWTLVTEPVATSFYIGTTLNTINDSGANFKVAFNNENGIKEYTIELGTDGKTYPYSAKKVVNTNDRTFSEVINEFKEGLNITNKLYIKISALDNSSSSVLKTRTFSYSLADGKSSFVGDSVVDMVSGVPIPKGFVASGATGENTKSNGLVIYEGTTPVTDSNVEDARKNRNQFVWIPVDDPSSFVRAIPSYDAAGQIVWSDTASSLKEIQTTPEYIEMFNSVNKYGGFYIARYESGIPNNQEALTSRDQSLDLCNKGIKPVSIKDANPWNYIPWGTKNNSQEKSDIAGTDPIDQMSGDQTADGAVKASRSLYPNTNRLSQYGLNNSLTNDTGVISTLCYAVCRDSVMRFVSDVINPATSTPYIVDSQDMGWYHNNYAGNTRLKTGIDINGSLNKVKNIYDLGGNLLEWTMEGRNLGSSSTYTRGICGGNYNSDPSTFPASRRQESEPYNAGNNTGFRIMLYIK